MSFFLVPFAFRAPTAAVNIASLTAFLPNPAFFLSVCACWVTYVMLTRITRPYKHRQPLKHVNFAIIVEHEVVIVIVVVVQD